MTSKLTREQVIALIAEYSYDSALVDALEYLAAAMDGEPIYQYQSGVYNDDNGETDWYWDDCDKGFYEQYAHDRHRILYRHAQPVPEKATVGEMPFLGVSEGVYVRGWNDCRATMLQENTKSAGVSNNCRSSENAQVMQDVSRCSTKAAPDLDSSPKTAESRCGNSPVIPGCDGAELLPSTGEVIELNPDNNNLYTPLSTGFPITKEMIIAGQEELEACIDNGFDSDADGNRHDYTAIASDAPYRVFCAMLAAAPQEAK